MGAWAQTWVRKLHTAALYTPFLPYLPSVLLGWSSTAVLPTPAPPVPVSPVPQATPSFQDPTCLSCQGRPSLELDERARWGRSRTVCPDSDQADSGFPPEVRNRPNNFRSLLFPPLLKNL